MEEIFSVQLEPQLALGLPVQVSLLIPGLKIKVSHDHNQEIDPEHLQMSIQTHFHMLNKELKSNSTKSPSLLSTICR